MSRKTSARRKEADVEARTANPLKAPFPYFGGKSRVAHLVWEAMGDPTHYYEPFFGSGAVLLSRPPTKHHRETINDKDGFVANFWRAVKANPNRVARLCDWPINEVDLEARHRWLCSARRKAGFLERMRTDPSYYDPKIAAWWCWGRAQWIGGDWCRGVWHGKHDPRNKYVGTRRPDSSRMGVHSQPWIRSLKDGFERLADRLREVDVLCGAWERVIKPSLRCKSIGAIFLDPPYAHSTGRDRTIYNEEMPCTGQVRAFCAEHGQRSNLRIVLAGTEGEYRLPGWKVVPWIRPCAMGRSRKARSNALRERLWLSPNCEITPAIQKAIRENRRKLASK